MITNNKSKTTFLVCLDQSQNSECVLSPTASLAAVGKSSLILFSVIESGQSIAHQRATDALNWEVSNLEAEQYLSALRSKIDLPDCDLSIELGQGTPADQIIELATTAGVDFIVLSTHGEHDQKEWVIGGTAQKVIANARTSLFIVPNPLSRSESTSQETFQKILVPLDGSQRAESVLNRIVPIASHYNSEVILVQVVNLPEFPRQITLSAEDKDLFDRFRERKIKLAYQYLTTLAERLNRKGVRTQPRILSEPDVRQTLVDLIEEETIDLLVLSAHGNGCNTNWRYGNVTASLLSKPMVPMMVIQDLTSQYAECPGEESRERVRVGSLRFDE